MALYVPSGARRRRVVLAMIGGLVLGLAAGFVAGRATSPGLEDEVGTVQDIAVDAATALERIPIEYEQAVAGEGGESSTTITEALDRAHQQLGDAYAEAIWLADDASTETDAAFEALQAAVDDEVDPADFEALVGDAVTAIRSTFALG